MALKTLTAEDYRQSEKPEEVKIIKPVRVRLLDGTMKKCFGGETVTVSGLDKLELLANGKAAKPVEVLTNKKDK